MTAAIITVGGILLAVAIHELGHFLVARLCKMDVECYFVGFGPKLFSRTTKSGVEVGLRALPIGGYVKIPGMDLRKADEYPEGTYAKASWWQQVVVCAAGPLTHFAIAFLLIYSALVFLQPTAEPGLPLISAVELETGAFESGLRSGDVVVSVNGKEVSSWDDVGPHFEGDRDIVTILRDGETVTLSDVDWDGTYMAMSSARPNPLEAVPMAGQATVEIVPQLFGAIADTFARTPEITANVLGGEDAPAERAMSLVGLAATANDLHGSYGWFGLLLILAQLNVFFALLNLLPIYPFDGGHVAASILARVTEAAPRLRQKLLTGLAGSAWAVVAALGLLFVATFVVDIIDIVR